MRARFIGIRTFMRLPVINTVDDVDFVVVGVPLDAATSFRSGARFGPEAIRSMSVLLRSYHPSLEIDPFDVLSGGDFGDCSVIPGYVEDSFERIREALEPIVASGVIPVLLGGDHSVTYPELRAVAGHHGPVALIHFDAHYDTREHHLGKPYGHGTPFRRAVEDGLVVASKSIHVGIRGSLSSPTDGKESDELGFESVSTDAVRAASLEDVVSRIRARVGDAPAFLSFDVDVLDPAFAPGTGTPAVGGLSSWEALAMVRGLCGVNLVGCDVVEVAPQYDPANVTALAAASVALEFLTVVAWNRVRSQDAAHELQQLERQ